MDSVYRYRHLISSSSESISNPLDVLPNTSPPRHDIDEFQFIELISPQHLNSNSPPNPQSIASPDSLNTVIKTKSLSCLYDGTAKLPCQSTLLVVHRNQSLVSKSRYQPYMKSQKP